MGIVTAPTQSQTDLNDIKNLLKAFSKILDEKGVKDAATVTTLKQGYNFLRDKIISSKYGGDIAYFDNAMGSIGTSMSSADFASLESNWFKIAVTDEVGSFATGATVLESIETVSLPAGLSLAEFLGWGSRLLEFTKTAGTVASVALTIYSVVTAIVEGINSPAPGTSEREISARIKTTIDGMQRNYHQILSSDRLSKSQKEDFISAMAYFQKWGYERIIGFTS